VVISIKFEALNVAVAKLLAGFPDLADFSTAAVHVNNLQVNVIKLVLVFLLFDQFDVFSFFNSTFHLTPIWTDFTDIWTSLRFFHVSVFFVFKLLLLCFLVFFNFKPLSFQ